MIIIEVSCDDVIRIDVERHGDRRLECAISIAKQHIQHIRELGDSYYVEFAIAVEVGDGNRLGHLSRGKVSCRLKSPVTVAQQYAYTSVVSGVGEAEIDNSKIGFLVTVEVGNGHSPGIGAHRIGHRRLEFDRGGISVMAGCDKRQTE